jgi:hypothetical protein
MTEGSMDEIRFKIPTAEKIAEKIRAIPAIGKPLHTKRNLACGICKRSILPFGKLPFPGFPTCANESCAVLGLSSISELFKTPYGCAVHLDILAILGRVVEINHHALLLREPIVKRADPIAQAYVSLLEWQQTFDLYERFHNPQGYLEGRVMLIPPRRIDEVVALRAAENLVPIDPTRRYPDDIASDLKRIKKKGIEGFELPF